MTSWAKMSANLDSNPKIRKAGREGREVFLFVLRRNAELDMGGRIPASYVEGWYLADQLMMPEQDALSGLSRCVRTGLLALDGDFVVIDGWDDEWGKRPLTEAERQAKRRARLKAESEKSATSEDQSRSVTPMSGHDRDCPDSHALEERRGEENRGEEIGARPADARPPSPPGALETFEGKVEKHTSKKRRRTQVPADWMPGDSLVMSKDELRELERFRNHHRSKGNTFIDIDLAWQNWRSRAGDYAPRNSNQQQPSALEAVLALTQQGEP